MNKNTRLELTDSGMSAAMKMSEGNPGARRVVTDLMRNADKIDPMGGMGGFGPILNLDSFGIYGARIWMLYKNVCGEDYTATVGVLRACQLGLISKIVLNTAIDNRGRGLDVEETLKKVREQLPNFGK